MEAGLLIIFWYGLLHAFGPDHLSAIADFSIGKSRQKTFFITLAFTIGHGIMLFVAISQYFASLTYPFLQNCDEYRL